VRFAIRDLCLFVTAMLICGVSRGEQLARYYVSSVTVTDLGTLSGGQHSDANDINDAGTIVGWSRVATGTHHAFVYSGGSMTNIGAAYGWNTASEARAINNSNVAVGYYVGAFGFQAFRWTTGGVLDLVDSYESWWWPPFPPMQSSAQSISDSGAIVGWRSALGSSPGIATVWPAPYSVFYDLEPDPWGVGTQATDINADGFVLGHGTGSGTHRWRFTAGTYPSPRVTVPGITGSTGNTARGINRWGGIVGYETCCPVPGRSNSWHATFWDGASANARDLGVLPTGSRSVAEDVNDAGFIAGYADKLVNIPVGAHHTPYSAFLHHRDFGMYELPKLPTTLPDGQCHARALNNLDANKRVQIVGSCDTGSQNGAMHAVRWDVILSIRRPLGPKP